MVRSMATARMFYVNRFVEFVPWIANIYSNFTESQLCSCTGWSPGHANCKATDALDPLMRSFQPDTVKCGYA